MIPAECILVVFDHKYGSRLSREASKRRVWMVSSQENMRAAEAFWRSAQNKGDWVTIFDAEPRLGAEAWCSRVLESIELHHGSQSQGPEWKEIEVIGIKVPEGLIPTMASLGDVIVTEKPDSFIVRRSPPRV